MVNGNDKQCRGRILVRDGDRAVHLAEKFAYHYKKAHSRAAINLVPRLAKSIEDVAKDYASSVQNNRRHLLSSKKSKATRVEERSDSVSMSVPTQTLSIIRSHELE